MMQASPSLPEDSAITEKAMPSLQFKEDVVDAATDCQANGNRSSQLRQRRPQSRHGADADAENDQKATPLTTNIGRKRQPKESQKPKEEKESEQKDDRSEDDRQGEEKPRRREFWGRAQSRRGPNFMVVDTANMKNLMVLNHPSSGALDTSWVTSSPQPPPSMQVGSGSAAMFRMFGKEVDDSVLHPDVSRVIKMLFASLSVVFCETQIQPSKRPAKTPSPPPPPPPPPTRPTLQRDSSQRSTGVYNDDGTIATSGGNSAGGGGVAGSGNSASPYCKDRNRIRYTRIPSIPAQAARMLWNELLGGIEYEAPSTGSNSKAPSPFKFVVIPALLESQSSPPQRFLRSSSIASMQTTSHQNTSQDNWDPSLTAETLENFVAFINGDEKTLFRKRKSGGNEGSSNHHGSSLLQRWPSKNGSKKWFFGKSDNQQTTLIAKKMTSKRRFGKDPFLFFVRDTLVDAGFLEIAGRRVDDDDDDDDDGDQVLSEGEDEVDGLKEIALEDENGNIDDDNDESLTGSSVDFSGWNQRKRIQRKAVQSQYFQIYKDMQHMYGVYLSSLPVKDGGFACMGGTATPATGSMDQSSHHGGENLDDGNGSTGGGTSSVMFRELDTMKRWNAAMCTANERQLLRAKVLDTEPIRRSSNDGDHGSNDASDEDDKSNKYDPRGSFVVLSSNTECDFSSPSPSWIAVKKNSSNKNPFDDAILYSLLMYPAHLMRCGRVVDAARILMNPRFFLARLCAVGAFDASNRHRTNLEELSQRSQLANEGQYEWGGDGDSINPTDVVLASVSVMIQTLKTRHPIETKDDGGSGVIMGGPEREAGDLGRAFHLIATFLAESDQDVNTELSLNTYHLALEYKTISLGKEHASVGRTYRHMGHQHLNQYDYKEAIECYSESVRIEQLQDEVDYKRVVLSLNSMGMIYGMTGEPQKAVECYSRSLDIQKAHFADTNLQLAETLNSLGIVSGMLGNYSQAVECYTEALFIKMRRLGKDHEDVADLYFNLGLVHRKQGDHDGAISSYQEALRIRKDRLGEEHEDVARVLHHIGVVLSDMGEVGDAMRFYEESLRIRRLILGDEHEDVARTLHNLGLVYYDNGDYERSLECFEDALRLGRKKVGKKSEKVADTLHSMGLVYQKLACFSESIQCYDEALQIRRDRLGNEHLEVASTLHNMGDVFYMMDELEHAMEVYHQADQIRIKKLGWDDVDVAATRNNMGVVHMKRHEHENAMDCFEKALSVRQRKLGVDHEKCSDTLHNMGLVHKNVKQYNKALGRYEQALRIRRMQLGENDMKVADTLYNMAIVYANTGQFAKALERYKEALRTYRETGMTDDHPSVVNTLQWIRWAQKKLTRSSRRNIQGE